MKILERAYNIEDLRAMARKRLPKGLFEFIDRGSEDEKALKENRAAFDRIVFYPQVLKDVSQRSLGIELFGKSAKFPIAVAPTGAVGLLWFDGEVAAARAAASAGVPYTLSTASIVSLEEVADRAGGDLWFQLYAWPQLSLSEQIINRARNAGYRVLVVTADSSVTSNREHNQRNAFTVPIRLNRRNIWDVLRHPAWVYSVMFQHLWRRGIPEFANLPAEFRMDLRGKGNSKMMPRNMPISRDVILRMRKLWQGPLVIKGILSVEDAELAADCGVDGIIVSNHGGRNLDGAMAPIEALPFIADAVGHKLTVLMDSGVRRGSDVVKALALGAQAVMVGRAPLWGTAVAGEPGAAHALSILCTEFDRVMAQLGCPTIGELDRTCLRSRSCGLQYLSSYRRP